MSVRMEPPTCPGGKFLGHREAIWIYSPGAGLQIRGLSTQHSTSILFVCFPPRKQGPGSTLQSRCDVNHATQPCFTWNLSKH